ncbi:class I SAM-dependent methyltransferase [bacterium]|nr:class I SAM-dependent methyltransferase [bacterium]NUP93466.1 class I SAM-dependent methyltransferase [Candidatus Omnitrophota bacterium]
MIQEAEYLAKKRFQLESTAAIRRMVPGKSSAVITAWATRKALALAGEAPVLDLACGNGRHFPELGNQGPLLFGGDISEPMLRVAQTLLELTRSGRGLVRLDAERLPFPDKAFGVTFCARFFHHLPSRSLRESILSEMFRISRHGVVLTCKARYSYEHISKIIKSFFIGQRGEVRRYYMNAREVSRTAESHGWELAEVCAPHPLIGANRGYLLIPKK